jgi:hypothetical protein
MAAMRAAKWGLTQACGWSMPCGNVAGDQEIGVKENADGVVSGGPSRK